MRCRAFQLTFVDGIGAVVISISFKLFSEDLRGLHSRGAFYHFRSTFMLQLGLCGLCPPGQQCVVCALYKGIVLQAVLGPVSPCTKTMLSDLANWAKE